MVRKAHLNCQGNSLRLLSYPMAERLGTVLRGDPGSDAALRQLSNCHRGGDVGVGVVLLAPLNKWPACRNRYQLDSAGDRR